MDRNSTRLSLETACKGRIRFVAMDESHISSLMAKYLPLMALTGVYVLTGTTKTTILAQADLPGVSMTVANGRIWLGGSQSEIWSRPL